MITNHPIPSHGGALLGRDSLLSELTSQIAVQRLLTLIGPGGVGKTSIAQHLAARLATAPSFADGVRWVDLAVLSDGTAVPQAVASACGLTEQRGVPWIETLVARLRSTQTLLVLDNCEHIHAACAEISAELLSACPHLHILATSREALGLPVEMRVLIPPLADADAMALFELRATTHLPSFTLNERMAPTITAICNQLDGVPLAIELAAARVTVLSVVQIAERLNQSLRLLTGRETNRPLRQRSLRAVLDWSYTLLDADEQSLLGQLAVFAGSFDVDGIEAVCDVPAPLDALMELVDKSLVVVTQRDEKARYRLHEVVRQYATEQLQVTGVQLAVRMRHLAWVVALAERAEVSFVPASQNIWLASLALEHENIRSALQTADDIGDYTSMLRLASALWQFWNSVSVHEGRTWLARGRAGAPAQSGIIAIKAWNAESFLAYRQGDYGAMHTAAMLALGEALLMEYAEGIAAARYRLGIHAEMKGATAAAREQYTQSLDLFRELGDRRGMSQTLNGLAHVANLEGNGAEARHYYREGLALARAENDHLTMALLLISLANLTLDEGDLDAAEAAYAESLAHLRAVEHPSYMLYAINGLGEVAYFRQDFAAATHHYQEGLHMACALGLKDMEAQFLTHLGRSATACGDYPEAARCLSAALRLFLPLERTMRTAGVIHFCAVLVIWLGYPAQATTLFAARLHAMDAEDFSYLGSEGAALLAAFEAARDALAPAEYALAVADGQALTLTQAADLALSAVYLPQRLRDNQPPPELRIFLFGQLRVLRDGHELTGDDWVYSKTKDLLVFLLLVDSADKAEIGAALWPDASPAQLKQNFRMAIYHLRRALGRAEWITFVNGRYAFNRTLHAWVDVTAFERAAELAHGDPAQPMQQLRIAAALYTGNLVLGDLESNRLLVRREQLDQQALAVLLALGELHMGRGHYATAADTYRRVIALDSYAETAHRGLMRSLAHQGETSAALAHYQRFVELLANELGIAPTPETAKLAGQIQTGTVI